MRNHRLAQAWPYYRAAVPLALVLIIGMTWLTAGRPARAVSVASTGATAAPVATRVATLINGDRLDVRTAAGTADLIAVEAAPSAGGLLSLRIGSLTEEIPADALPYVGRGLNPDLFNLGDLERAEGGGRVPLEITFSGRLARLPGVKISHSGRGSATGYLTTNSASAFGAALARQFRFDHRNATYGEDGLFAHGVQISLAGMPSAPQPLGPSYQMRTLTVIGRNIAGTPDTGDEVMVFNVANPDIYGAGLNDATSFFYRGVAKFSVPVGTYWAIGEFSNGAGTAVRISVLPQFKVRNDTTVAVSEQAATSEITIATPRPTVTDQKAFELIRYGNPGSSVAAIWYYPKTSLWVSPTTAKPTLGSLQTFTAATMTSPPKVRGSSYAYNLLFAGPRDVIPAQHYVALSAQLAAVTERIYQGVKSVGSWSSFAVFPAQFGELLAPLLPVSLPIVQTEYFSAGPGIAWQSQYVQYRSTLAGGQTDATRTFPAGQHLTEDWGTYPLHPQPVVQLLGGRFADLAPKLPAAYRTGNELNLDETPFSDNTPGHLGGYIPARHAGTSVASYAVYENRTRIAAGTFPFGVLPGQQIQVRVSPKPSVIRFVLDAATRGPVYPLSPSSQTTWTWKTYAQPRAQLPDGWYCGITDYTKVIHKCAVQPLLTLSYLVHGMSLAGLAAPGAQQVDISVGHLQLAPTSPVTRATAQYSLNDGRSWRSASVTTAGSSQVQIDFDAPAGTDVSLRVTATDAAGSSITETIDRAYGIAK